jgi:UDP-N-acetylglucosamine--N-acetylmuramyl-(pentapeptide) pyrophosphoryl-undecaprenol N-acetylglucosamine transferase
MTGFPEAAAGLAARRVEQVGNPVRRSIADLAGRERAPSAGPPKILVLGGSQGSRSLNLAVGDLVPRLAAAGIDFRLTHQTGAPMAAEMAAAYGAYPGATAVAFIRDMAPVLAETDLAVARAGASTLAEFAAAGIPAVLVPLPSSAGGHQEANARSMERAGQAVVVLEKDIPSGALFGAVGALLGDGDALARMRAAGRGNGGASRDAAGLMARLVLSLAEEKKNGEGL